MTNKYGDEDNPPDFKSALRYDKESGNFYWTKRVSSRKDVGDIAGRKNTDGGIVIMYDKRNWHASRLAWYFEYGHFPRLIIDHINGNRGDNRIINLREVTIRENNQNKKIHREGRLVGTYKRYNNKWSARIQVGNKDINLGTFDTESEANEKYQEACITLKKSESEVDDLIGKLYWIAKKGKLYSEGKQLLEVYTRTKCAEVEELRGLIEEVVPVGDIADGLAPYYIEADTIRRARKALKGKE